MRERIRSTIPLRLLVSMADALRARLERLVQVMVPAHFALLYEISGVRTAQAVCTAAKFGIADALEDGPLTVEDIAIRVDAHPDAIARLMRLLSSRSIFARTADGRYRLTPMADALRTGSPVSMRAMALLTGSPEHWEHWGHLPDSVRTGSAFVPTLRGMSLFEYLETNPAFADIFNDAMTSVSNLAIKPLLAAYDFSRFRTIVDIGGGHGALIGAILQRSPASSGILFDLSSVTEGAPSVLGEAGVSHRCTIESGSFFTEVPLGGDAYVLKAIVHDWAEADAVRILKNVRSVMATDSTLLLIEMVIPEDRRPHTGKLLDLDMLLTNGGRERTSVEYAMLLEKAGFRMNRIVPTVAPMSIIEAAPV
jgi:O-methyltransferase domain/Dimerisation domain